MRRKSTMQTLLALLLAAHAGATYAAEGPFIPIDLGVLVDDGCPCTSSGAQAVNDRGQVVGASGSGAGSRPFLWTLQGGMVDLGTLGGSSASAVAVSANGHVVGQSRTAGNAEDHAFLCTSEGGVTNLVTLGCRSSSTAV